MEKRCPEENGRQPSTLLGLEQGYTNCRFPTYADRRLLYLSTGAEDYAQDEFLEATQTATGQAGGHQAYVPGDLATATGVSGDGRIPDRCHPTSAEGLRWKRAAVVDPIRRCLAQLEGSGDGTSQGGFHLVSTRPNTQHHTGG